ncbi:hypothetical protein ACQPYK_04280 [Streptosporangium sp. CA-135522]|uniref:hypothetical protein n=1 Tax=Streptosporangium sp. CA-135522 TaxID=3240072 RepID=UPI003D9442BB
MCIIAFGAAAVATLALVLPDQNPAVSYPVAASSAEVIPESTTPSSAALPKMPKLWNQDAETARTTITDLGFDATFQPVNGQDVKVPADWIVIGQSPFPGTILKSTIPIMFQVAPKNS